MVVAALIVPDLLRQRLAEAAESTALEVDGGASLTYRDWDQRSNAIARALVGRGVAPQDRVALVFDNLRWLDYAVAYLGVHKAGGVAVPLGPRFSGPELSTVLRHCGAGAVVSTENLVVDGDIDASTYSLDELEAEASADAFQVPLDSGDLAEILYTSGTTGLPKGVACTHESVLFHDPPPEQGELPGPASFVHAFPIGTNAGQEVLRLPLRRSDRVAVVLPVFDPERYCAVIADRRVRRLQLVPAMAQLIVNSGASSRYDVSSVERIVLSSAPSSPALLMALAAAFPGVALWNTYALTEAGTARTLNQDALARPTSVGRPVGQTELLVVDVSDHRVPTGSVGEILIRRPGAPPRSYYRDTEATEATFTIEGWVRTGDLGYVDEEGYLFLVDRKKDLVIVGGLNVSSVEVENVLYEHPAVAEAAVFAVDHPILGQDVAACVVLRSPVDGHDLQAFVRARLGEHKVPHRLEFVDHLPRTASGKVRKVELRSRFAAPRPDSALVAPRTPVEAAIVTIWEEVLGATGIGVDDDFFDVGGHSLAAAQIMTRIEATQAVELPVTTIFERSTPAALAAAVEEARATAPGGPGPDASPMSSVRGQAR